VIIITRKIFGQMARDNHLAGQWQLLKSADPPSGVTVDVVAEELSFTLRTIWFHFTMLQLDGFPVPATTRPGLANSHRCS